MRKYVFRFLPVVMIAGFLISCDNGDNDNGNGNGGEVVDGGIIKKLLPSKIVNDNGLEIAYTYDASNRIIKITERRGNEIRDVSDYEYDKSGVLIGDRYSFGSNFTIRTYQYSSQKDTIFKNYYSINSTIEIESVDTMLVDNKGFLIRNVRNSNTDSGNVTWTYDADNFLTKKIYHSKVDGRYEYKYVDTYIYDNKRACYSQVNMAPWLFDRYDDTYFHSRISNVTLISTVYQSIYPEDSSRESKETYEYTYNEYDYPVTMRVTMPGKVEDVDVINYTIEYIEAK